MDPWLDQWHRVRRWLDRFTETNSGRSHTKDSDNYQDEVYAFFQNCYHLKDWLINDPVTSALVSDVETMISIRQTFDYVPICATVRNIFSSHVAVPVRIQKSATDAFP